MENTEKQDAEYEDPIPYKLFDFVPTIEDIYMRFIYQNLYYDENMEWVVNCSYDYIYKKYIKALSKNCKVLSAITPTNIKCKLEYKSWIYYRKNHYYHYYYHIDNNRFDRMDKETLLKIEPQIAELEITHPNFWTLLSGNPNAIPVLESNQDKIDWGAICENPNAYDLLNKNRYKILDWALMARNINPDILNLIEEEDEFIEWDYIMDNPSAIEFIKRNIGKIYTNHIFDILYRDDIFTYDYEEMRIRNRAIKDEIISRKIS